MTVLLSVLGLLAVAVLTLGTAVAVASEFALTALERSQVDAAAAAKGDRRARIVQRAHRSLSFQLSASQLLITVTTLATGYIAEPAIATLFVPGLAALGLSDTANASLIFEKYGISARVTYNWRDRFLSNNSRGSSRNPVFVAPYHQIDANISYDITPHIGVSFEAINITKEDTRTYARTENEPWFIVEGNSRYLFGAHYKF